jgi:sister-chromatid-cohesion protein PDS5
MFKSHVAELVKGLAEEENEVLVETCLHALARLAVWDPTVISKDR